VNDASVLVKGPRSRACPSEGEAAHRTRKDAVGKADSRLRRREEETKMNTKTILVPVDFSKGSEQAVAKAAELARALGAPVHLFHVYQVPVLALPDAPVMASPTFIADLTSRAQAELNRHREALATAGVKADAEITEGVPATTIVEKAKSLGASMIVMGTHGRSGFQRFLLGSTAERVVRTASTPVLTVHLDEGH
jgi:nucleotide-binding universal stress UspA family protein